MSSKSGQHVSTEIIKRLAELIARRPELRGVGISGILEGVWSQ